MFFGIQEVIFSICLLLSFYYIINTRKIYLKTTDTMLRNLIRPYFLIVLSIPTLLSIFFIGNNSYTNIIYSILFLIIAISLWFFAWRIHLFSKEYGFISEKKLKKLQLHPILAFIIPLMLFIALLVNFKSEISFIILFSVFLSFLGIYLASLSETEFFMRKILASFSSALFISFLSLLLVCGTLLCYGQTRENAINVLRFALYIPLFLGLQIASHQFSNHNSDMNFKKHIVLTSVFVIFLISIAYLFNPVISSYNVYYLLVNAAIISTILWNYSFFKSKGWVNATYGVFLLVFSEFIRQIVPSADLLATTIFVLGNILLFISGIQYFKSKNYVMYPNRPLFFGFSVVSLFLIFLCTSFSKLDISSTSFVWKIGNALSMFSFSILVSTTLWIWAVTYKFSDGALKKFLSFIFKSFILYILYFIFLAMQLFAGSTIFVQEIILPFALIIGIYANNCLKQIIF